MKWQVKFFVATLYSLLSSFILSSNKQKSCLKTLCKYIYKFKMNLFQKLCALLKNKIKWEYVNVLLQISRKFLD